MVTFPTLTTAYSPISAVKPNTNKGGMITRAVRPLGPVAFENVGENLRARPSAARKGGRVIIPC